MATDVQIPRPVARSAPASHAATALVGLAGVAGLVHLVAAIEHVTEPWTLPVFFLVVGAGQLFAAWAIHRDPRDERLLKLVAVGSVGVALLWIFSRTTGVPVGPDAGEVESVGVADTIATMLELGLAALAGTILWRGERAVAWLAGPIGIRLTYAVLSLTLMMAAFGGHEH
jgi:hypothetical protein